MIKKEIRIFLTAIMFFTRIPCPKWIDHSDEYLNKATKYFPLMGWIVGGGSALVFFLLHFIFPVEIALLLSMITSVWITGGFHEDGFADVCDGFGGGWTKEKILDIMKDSRVGAFGVIGLLFILALKFSILNSIEVTLIPFAIISAHALSRFSAVTIIYTHEYVRENESSKAKPLATKISLMQLIVAAFFGIVPLFLFQDIFFLLILIPVLLTKLLMANYFKKWIGGYTGDCLGATQQVTEIIIYLCILTAPFIKSQF